MTDLPEKLQQRHARKNAKRDEKKRLIAESAIKVLKELGYANTSLRDIAEKCGLSLGMLHYYFEDRSDLIIYCASVYKQEFARNIIDALSTAQGRDQVIDAFAQALASSIIDERRSHSLWYDIRTQAMFDETFRAAAVEIENMLIAIVRTAFEKTGHTSFEEVEIHYALLDGVFRFLMQNQIGARPKSHEELAATFKTLLERFL